jgi:hypothetical protein
MATLHEDLCTSMVISHSILHHMRFISDRFIDKIKTHCLLNKFILFLLFFFFLNCAIKEIMWKNVIQLRQAPADSIVWCMCVLCYMTKTTDSNSEYLIGLLIAFSWQQCLCEQTSMLCYMYIVIVLVLQWSSVMPEMWTFFNCDCNLFAFHKSSLGYNPFKNLF